MRIVFIFLLILSVAFCDQNNTKPSLKRMIGQMIVAGFDSTSVDSKEFKQLLKDLSYGRIGGIILLEKNFQDKEQLLTLIDKIRHISTTLPPFLGIDEKTIYKLNSSYIDYDMLENMAINSKPVKTLYTNIADDIKSYSINLNLAPNVNTKNKILKNNQISAYANEFIDIFTQKNVIPVMKYFPSNDSAKIYDYSDLKVYFDMIGKIDIIMSSSAKFSNLDPNNEAYFSNIILYSILRKELGFNGVIMSDDLLKTGNIIQNAIKAIIAGNDIVFVSSNLHNNKSLANEMVNAINKAVIDGKISSKQIESSYLRIKKLKEKLR
ncbi:glycosyl hydrolase family protein [Campylobacter sputorum subsp. bubulus]|uniref:beta-N-acetylhexosaminidase n=1 Tax=Campylobacter sputorum subsp. sputorum TaxID=32024 RepID=A0A381DK23_9BACT|nr:glycoside hydrolase family 3 N-terminal domain-containing protein [Campylobacter sputorum]ASM34304.1 glycosyl hydrolase, family 3 [Campylobacter sputorum aubsp. sputorum RM3237]KAB0582303.1 glycoside hydrolase family 3 protein [Campylobacter sputorum subsp. sputorum]QEL04495.1 glycosyl hydrolase, family 3 [Campylobacter sputorum subsp. sputorum]SUX09269.1 glycosyl hydrolase family protein [Campylobacter sputorum subsp. bubulus]SUX10960.1 glycosyl hydrolase family protein [Campylobacter sput